MINFDDVTGKEIKEQNPNSLRIPAQKNNNWWF